MDEHERNQLCFPLPSCLQENGLEKKCWSSSILDLEIRETNEAFQNNNVLKLFFKIALCVKGYNKAYAKKLEVVAPLIY